MNTKILKIATFAFLSGGVSFFAHASDDEAAAGISLDSIRTLSGKSYHQVELINADAHGLMFRHAKGTAKIDFTDLNANLREMFETERPEEVVKTPRAERNAQLAAAEKNGKGDDAAGNFQAPEDVGDGEESIEIFTRTRVRVYPQPQLMWWTQPAWLPQWGRYQGAHAISYFYNRQLIEQDFLISSGLVPAPRGVVTRRLPRRGY